MALFVSGCTSMSYHERKFDRYTSGFSSSPLENRNVEKIVVEGSDSTIHYLCLNYGTSGVNCYGWYCWEYHERQGHIFKRTEYWVDYKNWQNNDKNFELFKEKIRQQR
jgi:hypothetical protein